MGKVYVIVSGKGGVGKTTSAVNLGFSMSNLGKEVIIVDANFTTPNIGLHLGSPIVPVTLNHVLNDNAKVEEAIYEHESGAKILPSSLSISDLKNLDIDRIDDVAKKLRKISDHIIIDSSAGLGDESKAVIRAADELIIITNPEISAVTDALKTIKLAEELDRKVAGVIITRHTGKDWEMNIETIKDMLEIPILGIIPEDESVKESQRMKNAVVQTHPKSKAARAYKKAARRILGPEYVKQGEKEEADRKKKRGFFERLFNRFGL